MFVMYFPQLIEAGMVFKAVPPLYLAKLPGNKKKYFTDNIDIVKYIQKAFLQKYSFETVKKEKISDKQITIFFTRNADYIYYLHQVADTYAINPNLLELVLYHYVLNKHKFNFEKLKKEISSTFRFMTVEKENNTIVVKGTIEKSNLIVCHNKFLNDCHNILNCIENNDELYYLIDSKKTSIYDIMKLYEASSPKEISRFKGLGEMEEDELKESTILGDRTLIKYTVDNIKECMNTIRDYESDTKKILKLIGTITREDLLD